MRIYKINGRGINAVSLAGFTSAEITAAKSTARRFPSVGLEDAPSRASSLRRADVSPQPALARQAARLLWVKDDLEPALLMTDPLYGSVAHMASILITVTRTASAVVPIPTDVPCI